MASLTSITGPMRPPFLLLVPCCVAPGLATAARSGHPVPWWQVVLILVGGLAAHVSVNALNEYLDFRSGLDLRTSRTPFSGGSGALPAHPEAAPLALATALVAGVLAAAVGLYFVWVRGPAVLPFGLLGLVVVVTYTSWATRHALVCLVAPGLGFGPCMVLGTHAALTGEVSGAALVASLVPFFLVSDLLLLNQFPDVEADRTIGRRHLPIVLGRQRSATVYAAFLAGAYLSIVVGVVLRLLPLAALLGLLTAPLAVKAAAIARRSAEDLRALMPALGMNVVVNLVTPVLLAAGIWLG